MNAIVISGRFNGPPASGNGGYTCGMLASILEGACRVRLHSPPPLDKALSVFKIDNDSLEMREGELLVGTAVKTVLDLDIPPAPTLEQAERASKGFLCYEEHSYPSCFVCGPGRSGHDGLCLYPGPVDDWGLLACVWQPAPDLLDEKANVRPEIVWSALDCPGYYAATGEALVPVLLGELTADLLGPVPGNKPLVVFAWPLGVEGRKLYGGVAIANEEGEILACSRSTWIALKF
jgi:hypothetical protein